MNWRSGMHHALGDVKRPEAAWGICSQERQAALLQGALELLYRDGKHIADATLSPNEAGHA